MANGPNIFQMLLVSTFQHVVGVDRALSTCFKHCSGFMLPIPPDISSSQLTPKAPSSFKSSIAGALIGTQSQRAIQC